MKAEILKWGSSLAVRIPEAIARGAHLKAGDTVELAASNGKLEIRRVSQTPTLSELVAGITPENQHGEISSGWSTGNESLKW